MNQKARQNAKTSIEKDFYKLMNYANFGHNCRNNVNNSTFEPIIDKVNEISYIKKYHSLFDSKISNFVNGDLLEKEIEQKFQQKITNIRYDNPLKNAKLKSLINQKR